MIGRFSRRPAALALALLAAAPAAAQSPARPAPQPPVPRLLVMITVDQLIPDYLERYAAQLTGGLGRLRRGGAYFPNAYQDHAVTETAPGHASILSGRFPRSTGIVSNSAGVSDPQAPLLGGGTMGASPFRFRGTTLVDWLRMKDPASRALSVSRKDRGAILTLGRAKQPAFWYAYDGRFTTSTYYADTLPTWVRRFNARRVPQRMAGERWTLLLPASAYPEPDSVPPENRGRDFTFPHVLAADSATAVRTFPEFPWMDRLTAELALEGLRAMELGRGPHTDVLAVSFSTTDAVGHRYGPQSREIHDQVLRLDRIMGEFLDSLYVLRDSSTVVVALTSDHGVSSLPGVVPGGAAGAALHVPETPFREWRARVLSAAGLDTAALVIDEGVVFMDRERFRAAGRDPDAVAAEILALARTLPGVLRADRPQDLVRDSARGYVERRWAHMLPPDLPVVGVITLKPRHEWGVRGWGQHGSPHDYDARVPLILFGAPFRPGTYPQTVRVVDLAPTLARVLRVEPAEALDGRVLTPALR